MHMAFSSWRAQFHGELTFVLPSLEFIVVLIFRDLDVNSPQTCIYEAVIQFLEMTHPMIVQYSQFCLNKYLFQRALFQGPALV